jgi:hypothetical protein
MDRPSFIDEAAFDQLLANGHSTAGGDSIHPPPIIKLFTPDANATWLLTEIDPDDEDLAFGLCDLGLGKPELGSVRLSELDELRGPFGLPVERDAHFKANQPLSAYAATARVHGWIAT